MSDLDDVLGRLGGPAGPLPVRAEERAHAGELVRRRRRRKAGLAGAGGVLSVSAVAVVALAAVSPGSISLEQQAEFAVGPSSSAEPTSEPTASASSVPSSSSRPDAGASPEAGSTAPAPAVSATATTTRETSARPKPPVTRTSERLSTVCGNENGGVGGGTVLPGPGDWCLTASVDTSAKTYTLNTLVCRGSQGSGQLSFRTAQETDFVVSDPATGEAVWTWSLGQSFAQTARTDTLAGGDCLRWRVKWDGVGDGGQTYGGEVELVLAVQVKADELAGKTDESRFSTSQ